MVCISAEQKRQGSFEENGSGHGATSQGRKGIVKDANWTWARSHRAGECGQRENGSWEEIEGGAHQEFQFRNGTAAAEAGNWALTKRAVASRSWTDRSPLHTTSRTAALDAINVRTWNEKPPEEKSDGRKSAAIGAWSVRKT